MNQLPLRMLTNLNVIFPPSVIKYTNIPILLLTKKR